MFCKIVNIPWHIEQQWGSFPSFFQVYVKGPGGGHSLAWSAEKVILIEKRSALHIFGYYSGKMCSRAGYFLSYTAYALAAGVKDPLMLEPYGKHRLIRNREPAPLGSLEQERSESSIVSVKKKKSSSQVKGRVPIGRPWEKPSGHNL